MTQRQRLLGLIMTLVIFAVTAIAAAYVMRYVIAFMLTNGMMEILAMSIFISFVVWFVNRYIAVIIFFSSVFLMAFIETGYIANSAREIIIFSSVIVGIVVTAYIRMPRRTRGR